MAEQSTQTDSFTSQLGQLYESTHKALINSHIKKGLDPEIASDLVQKLFARITRTRPNIHFDEPKELEKYISVANKRMRIDYFRSPASRENSIQRESSLDDNEWDGDLADQNESIEDGFDRKEAIETIRAEMALMTPEERELIEMKFFLGLEIPEIANIKGIHKDAAKSQIYRAFNKMKSNILTRVGDPQV